MDEREEIPPQHEGPRRFGKYEVLRDGRGKLRVLGSGSYGRTYRARHTLLGTEVAIKVIRREVLANESVRQRFLAEGRALTRLAHENIALLRHFDQTDGGELYYAMDFCAGGTLAERVRRLGPRPVGEALEIVRQAAEGLAAAHDAGIVHRDLKPGNVMLAGTPPPLPVKVIDFGLAQGSGGAGGKFRGTVQWASPEQLREEPLDGRSDLFSLGLILWYLLDGNVPDDGETGEVLRQRLAPGGYAERLPAQVPDGLRELLARLLETDPSKRPGSAAELLSIIGDLQESHPYEHVAESDPRDEEAETDDLPTLAADVIIDQRYARLTRLHRDLAGEWFEAELAKDGGSRIVFVLDERWAENPVLRKRVKSNIACLSHTPIDSLPTFVVLQETVDGLLAEWDGPIGGDLASWLKLKRKMELREAMGFLVSVAQIADEAVEVGIPGAGLMAGQVRWETAGSSGGGGGLDCAAPLLFPLLLNAEDLPCDGGLGVDASGSTMALIVPELACDRCYMLSALVYRMISGREPAAAVAHTPDAYVPVSGLSESGNLLLRDELARRGEFDRCVSVLRALAGAEGLSLGGRGASGTREVMGTREERRENSSQRSEGENKRLVPVSEKPEGGVVASETGSGRGERSMWKVAGYLMVGILAAALAVLAASRLTNRGEGNDRGDHLQHAESNQHLHEDSQASAYATGEERKTEVLDEHYLRIGWREDAAETLTRFLAADTIEEKAALSIGGAKVIPEMEKFYDGRPIDDSDTPVEAFSANDLRLEDRERGLFLMKYDQLPQFQMGEFFRLPAPPANLEAQHQVESVRVLAFLLKEADGMKVDWHVFIQTKHRLMRSFGFARERGRTAVLRVIVSEDVSVAGRDETGMQTYLLVDPAHKSDGVLARVPVDSEVGRLLSAVNWSGSEDGGRTMRTATVELAWEGDDVAEIVIRRFICWEFLGLGGVDSGADRASQ